MYWAVRRESTKKQQAQGMPASLSMIVIIKTVVHAASTIRPELHCISAFLGIVLAACL